MAGVDKSLGGFGEPASNAYAITPSDSAEVDVYTRAIYVGVAGDLAVTMLGGGNATFVGVPAGLILPIRVTKVLDTGTTADSILGLY